MLIDCLNENLLIKIYEILLEIVKLKYYYCINKFK